MLVALGGLAALPWVDVAMIVIGSLTRQVGPFTQYTFPNPAAYAFLSSLPLCSLWWLLRSGFHFRINDDQFILFTQKVRSLPSSIFLCSFFPQSLFVSPREENYSVARALQEQL